VRPAIPAVLIAVALCACGSDEPTSPSTSTPVPPVVTPLDGSYTLVVTPASGCGLPEAPYRVAVEATSFPGISGTELHATTEGDDTNLVLAMLYSPPGWLQGSISTRAWATAGESSIFIRASGTGQVSTATGGRAEVKSGTLGGDVSVDVGSGDVLTCSSIEHSFAILAR